MNCTECRQELELHFGDEMLIAEVTEHLAQCEECRAYQAELGLLADGIDAGDAFALDASTVEQLARQVEARVSHLESHDDSQPSKRTGRAPLWSWLRAIPAAAAVMLVFGIGIAGYWLGRWDIPTDADTTSAALSSIAEYADEDDTEPDDITVRVLLDDFAVERRLNASESLLDGISQEELEYLESNFDIGEIL